MQRFPATSCGGGINNIAVGGTSSRDTARADSPFSSSNFSVNQRRSVQLAPYKLTCDKEPLNGRLGAPDYYPQTPNCPEETLTKEYVQHGYRETVDGLEEAREITLSQLGIGTFTKPVVVKCKEASCINGILFHPIYFLDDPVSYCWAIRKRLRAINESRAQKRKAGQVYGVPLSGSLLTRPCVFPEQKQCGEDFRRKWVESLSQPHKRLRLLSEHVPLGYRRKSLFEVLIKHNVPLLRATWFIKVTYLNQVRPVSSSVSSGAPDKTQLSRSELWSKDVTEYLQYLLDEFFAKDGSFSTPQGRDQSPQMLLVASIQSSQAISDGDEPSFHFKWWYMVRIIQWHYAEGLLIPSHIIDWVFERLQEKESFDSLQLLLPIVIGLIETIVLSQTYVRNLVEVAVRCIQEPSPGGSSLLDNSRRSYMITALVEMLRYLLVAVPDTFVALDCFPLPPSVSSDAVNEKSLLSKAEDVNMIQNGPRVDKGVDVHRESFNYCVSSVRQRADNLAKVASPTAHGGSVAKAVQALDRSLNLGDVSEAYNILFEGSCMGGIEESWIAEVSSCLRASLKWIGSISLSSICSVFFLCEWATCDFRDFRTALPPGLKLTGRKDFSQVHTAVLLFKLLMEEMNMKGANLHERFSVGTAVDNVTVNKSKSKTSSRKVETEDMFESPGPMHDILVCWIDQHDVGKGEGFKRLQLLLVELIQSGIFCPQAYLRQLIVSGILDRNETPLDLDRRQRHYQILKQLPGTCLPDLLKEARVSDGSLLLEAMHVYSNERCLVLHGLASCKFSKRNATKFVPQTQKDNLTSGRTGTSSACLDNGGTVNSAFIPFSVKNAKVKPQVAELKLAITLLLHLPNTSSVPKNTQIEDSQGIKRSGGSSGSTVDVMEGTDGCEDCRRAKRLKLSDERSSYQQGSVSNPSDDEDTWWVRKGPKSMDSFKVDPPLKSTKLASRGRQKVVRKTQSLAQLAAARIEGSQGASTSHVCDNKVSCPHHRNGMESEIPKAVDAIRATDLVDVVKIGKALKQLRLLERRTITVWLITLVRQLVEGPEKTAAKLGQGLGSLSPIDERNPQWKLDEDELSAILYLIDVSSDLVSAVKFLLWLLGKIRNGPNPTFHGVRSILMLPKNAETHACDVGEAFILSCIRRYESILVAANLLPEALSATMHRAAAVMVTNGRASGSSAFIYGRNLLKKYGNVASVAKWEKSFKTTCDQRLLAELESGRSLDGEFGFSPGVPAGVEDLDGYIRQKIASCRSSRAAPSMKEVVAKRVDEAVHYFYGKERKLMAAGSLKSSGIEKWDDGYQKAQQIVLALMECIRQNGGTAQEGDHSLVVSAVAAIVGSVGLAVAKMLDFTTTNNHPKFLSPINSLNCARRVVHIHVTCLCLLKEALGERQYRAFEIALATEASSAVAGAVAPGKASRSQFTESHDSNSNLSNENLNSSTKVALARATKAATAVSALVIGAVVHGVLSLDRMVTLFRLKEGLDILQFIRSARSNSNGISRSTGALKVDNSIEVNVHWFRLLIGNCRTISDGLVVELLGEPYILALSRMQRTLPISLVFPPAYSIFTMVIWRPYILNGNIANREDIQMYQSLTMALEDAMRHQPFRDVCLRDTRALYDNLVSDGGDSEFAAMLELHGSDKHLKTRAFVPLRARLFLNSILDCKLPPSVLAHGDGSWVHGHGESRHHSENETKLVDKLLHVLDTLQPAKFHWQWVDLRLLLNEQVLIDKIEGPYNLSLLEAVRSLLPNNDASLTDAENNFTDIVVTRLLVRPDAAPLYAEVLHLFGRAFEDSLSLNVKWFLAGHDVLYGRKSIRQRLVNIAQQRNLSTKVQFWRPWGWSSAPLDVVANKVDKMFEATSLEEGEVVEEGSDLKKSGKVTSQITDTEGLISSQPYVTEKALVDLVHACMDCISSDARNTFANDMIKQLSTIEQQISLLTGGSVKQAGNVPIGVEGGTASKSNNRKAMRGGSPGLGRRITAAIESVPPSSMALRASMWLRLQFLLRLLPTIYSDREPSGRSMRHMLATITLRLLGSRVVYVDADLPFVPIQSSSKRDADSVPEPTIASSLDLSVQSLFDQLLSVLYGLLSSWKPSWLKPKSTSKSTVRSPRDFSVFDREVVESLQSDLDRMQLPESVRWRLQAAMPVLPRFPSRSISCQPPLLSSAALASLYSNISSPGSQQGSSNQSQRSSVPSPRVGANAHGKSRPSPLQDQELEIDPWTLLEDGTGSLPSSSNSTAGVTGDQTNLKACHWLKGAVRVRRTELTYIGAVDDDS